MLIPVGIWLLRAIESGFGISDPEQLATMYVFKFTINRMVCDNCVI